MAEDGTQQGLPTVAGFAVRRAIEALQTRNIAMAPLLQRAGLSKHHLDDPRHRISAIGQGRLLEYAAEALNDNALGLHLAQQTNPREAGLLFYVASAANDLGEALALLKRYFRIVNEAVRLKTMPAPNSIVVQFSFVGLSRHGIQQNLEFGISLILKALREAAGRNIRPIQVSFTVARDSGRREFERFYGCPVEFDAAYDQLAFSNGTLALPLITEDRYLLETLRPICDAAVNERPAATETLRAAVENEARRLLPHGKAQKQNVAKALALSARTLSRKLANEGTTYAEVLDQLRRSLALQYTKERSISLSQVAWLLGYEDLTSFNHAFKRWTGSSPSVVRKSGKYARLIRAE